MTQTPPHSQRLSPGTIIDGKYRIVRPIGQGGMAVVFEAVQLATGRSVALKTLLPQSVSSPAVTQRFERELKVVSQLAHPNTITVLDAGSMEDGTLYFAMELLRGQSLRQRLERSGPMTPEAVRLWMVQALKGLAEAHACGIIHRDIKPANLFLCQHHGEDDVVKILDFGIAWALNEDKDARLTQNGKVAGTPAYMAPEQFDELPLGPYTDLYALAHTAHEMLCGQVVYNHPELSRLLAAKLSDEPLPMHPDVEASMLGPVLRKASEPNPDKRYQDCAQMLADLEALGHQRTLSGPPTAMSTLPSRDDAEPISPVPTTRRRRHWGRAGRVFSVAMTAAFLAAMGLGGGALAWYLWGGGAKAQNTMVKITVVSQPLGATVVDRKGNKLGVTPLVFERARNSRKLKLTLRKDGFRKKRLRVDTHGDHHLEVVLKPSKDKAPVIGRAQRKEDKPATMRRVEEPLPGGLPRDPRVAAAQAERRARAALKDAQPILDDLEGAATPSSGGGGQPRGGNNPDNRPRGNAGGPFDREIEELRRRQDDVRRQADDLRRQAEDMQAGLGF